jgi:transposase
LFGEWTPSGLRYIPKAKERHIGGTKHDDKRQQIELIGHVMDQLGNDAWTYANLQGHKVKRLKSVFLSVLTTCGYPKLPYETFYKWFIHYLKYGETAAETNWRFKRNQRFSNKKRFSKNRFSKKRFSKFNPDDVKQLLEIVEEQPHLYLDEIQNLLQRRTRGKTIDPSTIWRRLIDEGYTLQVCIFNARQRNEAERDRYRHRLGFWLKKPEMAIFVDETHRSANASRRRRAWAKRGAPRMCDLFFEEDFRKRYTLIGACDCNGFVEEACTIVERERDKNDRDPSRGTVDHERFEDYIEFDLCPLLGNYSRREARSIVILDNASIHNSDRVRQLILSRGAKLIFTAPYSPDLNPIELFFSVYKAMLQRYSYQKGYSWQTAHRLALRAMTPEKARHFYQKAQVPNCESLMEEEDDDDCEMVAVLVAAHVFNKKRGLI